MLEKPLLTEGGLVSKVLLLADLQVFEVLICEKYCGCIVSQRFSKRVYFEVDKWLHKVIFHGHNIALNFIFDLGYSSLTIMIIILKMK